MILKDFLQYIIYFIKAKPRRKTETLANGEEKVFVCDRCGVKYKTKPGLNYHIQKAHIKNNNTPNSSHSGGSGGGGGGHQVSNATTTSSTSKSNDALNPDENTTNSIFESHGYDDVNSSSSLSQATVANHEKQAGNRYNKSNQTFIFNLNEFLKKKKNQVVFF